MIVSNINELRRVSEEINVDSLNELNRIVTTLEEELAKHKTGIGLSAIQMRLPKRVAIIKIPNKEKIVLFNTKILERNEPFKIVEGCLSLPGLAILTKRYKNITIENGDGQKYSVDDMEAVAIQHEIDHWNGKLIIDRKWKKRGKR